MSTLPDLTTFDAVLFDLDGVLTPTAQVHMHSWREMFKKFFAEHGITPPYEDQDYYTYVDGKKRYDGVASLLKSRGFDLPWGDPSDSADRDTICGVGNRKNVFFEQVLSTRGIAPYPGSLRLLDMLKDVGKPIAVVSSSKNARKVLEAAGIIDRFDVIMDGVIAERENLPSKPAPDVFVAATGMLGVDPSTSAAAEDAISGVQSIASGGFGLAIGVDRGAGHDALSKAGANVVVSDLGVFVP